MLSALTQAASFTIMTIPLALHTLINRLNQELAQTEQAATAGLNLLRDLLSRFPDNTQLIQFFAYLNTVIMFIESSRRRIQTIMERMLTDEITAEEILEAGEDLGALLGQVLETKIEVRLIITRLSSTL